MSRRLAADGGNICNVTVNFRLATPRSQSFPTEVLFSVWHRVPDSAGAHLIRQGVTETPKGFSRQLFVVLGEAVNVPCELAGY